MYIHPQYVQVHAHIATPICSTYMYYTHYVHVHVHVHVKMLHSNFNDNHRYYNCCSSNVLVHPFCREVCNINLSVS